MGRYAFPCELEYKASSDSSYIDLSFSAIVVVFLLWPPRRGSSIAIVVLCCFLCFSSSPPGRGFSIAINTLLFFLFFFFFGLQAGDFLSQSTRRAFSFLVFSSLAFRPGILFAKFSTLVSS